MLCMTYTVLVETLNPAQSISQSEQAESDISAAIPHTNNGAEAYHSHPNAILGETSQNIHVCRCTGIRPQAEFFKNYGWLEKIRLIFG